MANKSYSSATNFNYTYEISSLIEFGLKTHNNILQISKSPKKTSQCCRFAGIYLSV